jgi:hypothetical protein
MISRIIVGTGTWFLFLRPTSSTAWKLPCTPPVAFEGERIDLQRSIRLYKPQAQRNSPSPAQLALACLASSAPSEKKNSTRERQGQATTNESQREGDMGGSGMAFEPHDCAAVVGGGDVAFFVVAILCLSVLSMIILAAAADGEGKLRRRSNGPVFVGGKGCGCGGCRAGAGVCGTYLS